MEIPEKGHLQRSVAGERSAEGALQSPQTDPGSVPAKGAENFDTVRLSGTVREATKAVERARQLPDVRMERVMQLKRQLAEGTYRVEGNRIAVGMMDESIENENVLKHIDTKA